MTREEIARICHEVNRAYCEALEDNSQVSWENAPEWQKKSAQAGVDLHIDKEVGPEASHEAWLAQKKAEGWRYGPEKSIERKEHPCMLPFHLLPKEQQAKDYIFRGIVHALRQYRNEKQVEDWG